MSSWGLRLCCGVLSKLKIISAAAVLFAADLVLVEAVLEEAAKGAGADGEEEGKAALDPIYNNELDDGIDVPDEEDNGEVESTLDGGTAKGVMGIAVVLVGSGTLTTGSATTVGSSFGGDGTSSFTISGTT